MKVFKRFIRDEKRNPYGVVMAVVDEDTKTVSFGWSKCRTKGEHKDTFNKKKGTAIAEARTVACFTKGFVSIPQSILVNMEYMVKKTSTYYPKESYTYPKWITII